jgi:hypothetical protein
MPEWVFQSLGYFGALAVGYAAIRADLARLHEKAGNAATSASRAHERIDGLLERAHG